MKKRFITIDGVDIEVNEDVYFAYKRPSWKEKKQNDVRKKRNISICLFEESGYELPCEQTSVEDTISKSFTIKELHNSLNKLNQKDKWLITTIYFDGKTERYVAEAMGLSQNTVNHHRKRILATLKKDLEKIF